MEFQSPHKLIIGKNRCCICFIFSNVKCGVILVSSVHRRDRHSNVLVGSVMFCCGAPRKAQKDRPPHPHNGSAEKRMVPLNPLASQAMRFLYSNCCFGLSPMFKHAHMATRGLVPQHGPQLFAVVLTMLRCFNQGRRAALTIGIVTPHGARLVLASESCCWCARCLVTNSLWEATKTESTNKSCVQLGG